MPKIQLLDEQTINQIAAGEVIENASSVIKELIENSLDSGATEIAVEIKAGGRQLIRIIDNGCGMSSDDALLALQRHATSKLQKVTDFDALATMGFRGEAIPSIASISKMSILTSNGQPDHPNVGFYVMVEGGTLAQQMTAARSRGTTIEVKSLFFNVPVRQKFQKSVTSDTAEAYKIVSSLALANPDIAFSLISDQKELLRVGVQAQSTKRKSERILDVLGLEFFQSLRPLDVDDGTYHFSGLIGSPSYVRHNRTGQYFFINRRPVVVSSLSLALKEGYGTRLAMQRYPVCVLYLQIPSDQIDVNVHPQKRQVRLRQEGYIKNILLTGIEKALRQGSSSHPPQIECGNAASADVERKTVQTKPTWDPFAISRPEISYPQFFSPDSHLDIERKQDKKHSAVQHIEEENRSGAFAQEIIEPDAHFLSPIAPPIESEPQELFQNKNDFIFSKPQIIGLFSHYLLLKGSSMHPSPPCMAGKGQEGILLLDLPGAQSRILFEQMMAQKEASMAHKTQALLLPLTIELSGSESLLLESFLQDLLAVGISIRPFGERTFLIDSLPKMMKARDIQSIISDMLENLQHGTSSTLLQHKRQQHIAMAASRAVGLQKQALSIEESMLLVESLVRCKSPYETPFGRAIWSYWSVDEVDKKFK